MQAPGPVFSAEDTTNSEDIPPAEERTESEVAPPGILDAGHARASAGVRGLGAWLDRLFSDEDYEAELNESRVRVYFDGFAEESEPLETAAKARVYLRLPGLGERVRAEILSSAEAEETETTDGTGPASSPTVRDDGNVTAALAYFFRNDEDRSISARLGLAFDGYTPDPYVGVRFRALVPLSEYWNFRFIERIRRYSQDGLESRTSIGFERGLTEDRLFRTTASGIWLYDEEEFAYDLGVSLFEPLDEKSAIEYQLVNAFTTNPHNLEQVTLAVRYRQQVWREWMVVEIAPQLAFPDDREFEPVPGVFLRLEVTFGG